MNTWVASSPPAFVVRAEWAYTRFDGLILVLYRNIENVPWFLLCGGDTEEARRFQLTPEEGQAVLEQVAGHKCSLSELSAGPRPFAVTWPESMSRPRGKRPQSLLDQIDRCVPLRSDGSGAGQRPAPVSRRLK